ncbi:MAG TPA: hypothetical protein VFE84_14960 [Patescibacteria group bacterium]|jgi:uncharacterized protein YoxC|nr:hypothetical protein [Patescibacteria group bacterium]
MELQLPVALQVALYAASAGIVVLVAGLLVSLFYFHRKVERIARAVEDLKAIVEPLAQETREVVQGLRLLTDQVQQKWYVLEQVLDTANYWRRRVDQLLWGSRMVIEAPIIAAGRKLGILIRGLFTRAPQRQ